MQNASDVVVMAGAWKFLEDKGNLSDYNDSLPVIINFNADFRGIFFFPNSPAVINGNQNNFEGCVIVRNSSC